MIKYLCYGVLLWKLVQGGISKLKDNIDWSFRPPALRDIRLAAGELDVRVRVTNNNPFSTQVSAFEGVCKIGGKAIATIGTFSDIEIPAGDTKDLKLTFKGINERAFNALAEVAAGTASRTITIAGKATIQGNKKQWVKVPVNYTHTF